MNLIDSDDENYILVLQRGESDLKNFIKLRVTNRNPLSQQEIFYIFHELACFQRCLYQYGIAFCDLKEENIMLTLTERGARYYLRLADLGGAYLKSRDTIYPKAFTADYFDAKLI